MIYYLLLLVMYFETLKQKQNMKATYTYHHNDYNLYYAICFFNCTINCLHIMNEANRDLEIPFRHLIITLIKLR